MIKNREFLKDKKIVVTGGAGFIGSHIVDELVSDGANVVVVDNLSNGNVKNLDGVRDKIEFHKTDIIDTDALKKIFEGAYAVLHEAALNVVPRSIEMPMETHMANSTGSLSVFIAAHHAKVDRVIYASSSSVYGNTKTLPKTEAMIPDPLSPYALQKLSMEYYAKIFTSLYGLKTIGLRYFNVFGPRQNPNSTYSAVIPKFIKLINEDKSPEIYGDGENFRDFTFIKNVVDANICALKVEEGFGEVFNASYGSFVSLNDMVSKINKIFGKSIHIKYLPERKGDVKNSFANIDKARIILGYNPEISFDEGLEKTVKSYITK